MSVFSKTTEAIRTKIDRNIHYRYSFKEITFSLPLGSSTWHPGPIMCIGLDRKKLFS
jgi:hypothetical protein